MNNFMEMICSCTYLWIQTREWQNETGCRSIFTGARAFRMIGKYGKYVGPERSFLVNNTCVLQPHKLSGLKNLNVKAAVKPPLSDYVTLIHNSCKIY